MQNRDINEVSLFFKDLLSEPYNKLIEKAVEEDMMPIGYTCSYIPEIILSSKKIFPVRLRAPGVVSTELADNYLSNVICSYTKSLLEFIMESQFDFIKGWIFTSACDHLRRLYDNHAYLRKPDFIHIIDLPFMSNENNIEWFTEELNILIEKISSHFGVEITKETLKDSITEHNKFVSLIKDFADKRKLQKIKYSGTEFHTMLMAAQVAPRKLILPYIEKFINEVDSREKDIDYKARLLVMGNEIDDPEFLSIIESQGAVVVADRFCTGSMPGLMPIELTDDPVRAIAEQTFEKTMCARIMEKFGERVNYLVSLVEEYSIDGVVIENIKFCDMWGIETGLLISALRERNIPVLKLEREYRLSSEGQMKTRVQAFLESIVV